MQIKDAVKTDPQLRQIQLACLNILKAFRTVCDENNLRYYLAYGTLLGAIRHQGYIPWDDDIDIWMPRPDFERFLEIAEKSMSPYVINYFTLHNDAGFKYRTQLCIEDHNYKVGFMLGNVIKPGYIWIDIIAMDGMPAKPVSQKIQCKRFAYWYAKIGFARSSRIGASNVKAKSRLKRFAVRINEATGIGKHIDLEKSFRKFKRVKMRYQFDSSRYVHGSTSYYTDKAVFPSASFQGERSTLFEGEMYSIPVEAEQILTLIYGDYMQMPPENKRTRSHFAQLTMNDAEE